MRFATFTLSLLLAAASWAANIKTATLGIDNMTCSICGNTVTMALQAVEGVEDVAVDLDKRTVLVRYDADKARAEALIEATADAGYPAVIQPK